MSKIEKENKRLHDEVRLLHNQQLENTDEINKLKAHIIDHARLRTLVRDLVWKIDAVITVRLTNYFRGAKRYPGIQLPENTDASPEEVLAALRKADSIVFHRQPALKQRLASLIAHILFKIYKTTVRLLGKTARFGLKIVRR